ELPGEVAGAVAAAAAQFQHLAHRPVRLAEQPYRERGLLGVLLRRRDQRPPRRQVLVEPVALLLSNHVPILHLLGPQHRSPEAPSRGGTFAPPLNAKRPAMGAGG